MSPVPQQKRGKSRQDYQTPPAFLRAVRCTLGIMDFAFDFAASPENAVVGRYYTEADNGLVQSWRVTGPLEWGWLNPPFSHIEPWVEKSFRESSADGGPRVAMLLPASVGSNWWRDWVHGKASVRFLNGRIQFVGAKDPYPKDCALLLYSSMLVPGYAVWTWPTKGV